MRTALQAVLLVFHLVPRHGMLICRRALLGSADRSPRFLFKIIGLIVYFWSLPLETQGKLDVKPPAYVVAKEGGVGWNRTAGDVEEQVIVVRHGN